MRKLLFLAWLTLPMVVLSQSTKFPKIYELGNLFYKIENSYVSGGYVLSYLKLRNQTSYEIFKHGITLQTIGAIQLLVSSGLLIGGLLINGKSQNILLVSGGRISFV